MLHCTSGLIRGTILIIVLLFSTSTATQLPANSTGTTLTSISYCTGLTPAPGLEPPWHKRKRTEGKNGETKKKKHPISDAATCTCKSLSLVIHSMTPQALVTSRSMTVTGVKKTKATIQEHSYV